LRSRRKDSLLKILLFYILLSVLSGKKLLIASPHELKNPFRFVRGRFAFFHINRNSQPAR